MLFLFLMLLQGTAVLPGLVVMSNNHPNHSSEEHQGQSDSVTSSLFSSLAIFLSHTAFRAATYHNLILHFPYFHYL
jgi:hypothetical protein